MHKKNNRTIFLSIIISLLFIISCTITINPTINTDNDGNDRNASRNNNKNNNNDNNNNHNNNNEGSDNFLIKIPADLDMMRTNPNGTFHLENDIDMTGIVFVPIPLFTGKFYGKGHKIDNLSFNITKSTGSKGIAFIEETRGAYFYKLYLDTTTNITSGNIFRVGISGLTGLDTSSKFEQLHIVFDLTTNEFVPTGGIVAVTTRRSSSTIINSYVNIRYNGTAAGALAGFIGSSPESGNIRIENSYVHAPDSGLDPSGLISYRGAFIGFASPTNSTIRLTIKNSFWLERAWELEGETIRMRATGGLSRKTDGVWTHIRNEGTVVDGYLLSAFTPIDMTVAPFKNFDTTIWKFTKTAGLSNPPSFQWE